jgi:enamine deaminase RidA (YjgF/YER057c/UK114 family)
MQRQHAFSGSPWEPIVGFSRAIRVGPMIFVSGTIGTDDQGQPVGDIEAQTRFAFRRVDAALRELGASLSDVVRTRMYLTDISKWETVAKVHAELFGDVRPAATMVQVSAFVGEGFEVEIEVDAIGPDVYVALQPADTPQMA